MEKESDVELFLSTKGTRLRCTEIKEDMRIGWRQL